MTDIVDRLRSWVYTATLYTTASEAADEIERLREAIRRLADQDATLSVVGGNVVVQMDCQDSSQENFPTPETAAKQETPCPYVVGKTTQHCSLTPFTLTDEEREAIRESCDEGRWYPKDYHHIHTLRGLLERLG